MSTKAVIVWLALALILGLAAIFLLRPSNPWSKNSIAIGDQILSFRTGDITEIAVFREDSGIKQIVRRSPNGKGSLGADADWQYDEEPARLIDSPYRVSPAWPLESATIHAFLRALSEARAVAIPPADADLGKPTHVEFLVAGSRHRWLLAERTLAGTGMIQIEPHLNEPTRRAIVPDQLVKVFTDPGPRAWRDRFPAGGISPDASRIHLTSKNTSIALAKSEGKWSVREPAPTPPIPADPAAVQRLLSDLARIRVADFFDQPSAGASTGLESPVASLTIEADRRILPKDGGEPTTSTDKLTLTIGGAADAPGTRLFASINNTHTLLLDFRSLAGVISMDAGAYIWPHPTRVPPADISVITLVLAYPLPTATSKKTFERTVSKWAQVLDGDHNAILADKDARQVDALLAFLTGGEKPAASSPNAPTRPAITTARPKDIQTLGAITVASAAGQTLDTIEIARASADTCTLRTGPVWRTYPLSDLPPLLTDFIAGSKPAAGSPSPPAPVAPTAPATPDVTPNK